MNANIPNGWPPPITVGGCGGSSGVLVPYTTQTDAFGRVRVSNPYTLFDSQQRFELDNNFISNTASGGTVTYLVNESTANLTVTNTVGSFVARETKWVFTYQPGKSLLIYASFVMAPASSGNLRQRVGYFGTSNGVFLELSDQTYMVIRSNTSGVVSETRVPQSSWSIDHLDGYGPSGVTLDITSAQLFWTDIEWLGVGNVRTGFIINGQYVTAHIFQHANYEKMVYTTTAILPVRYEIETLAGLGPATSNLKQICSTVISEGGYEQGFRLFSNIAAVTRTMTAGVWYPVISLRLAPGRLDAGVFVEQIDVIMTTTDVLHWALWSNVSTDNLTGENFVAHQYSTNVEVDASATAMTTTGCIQVAAGLVSGTNQAAAPSILELAKYYSQIGRDSFTQTSRVITLATYSVTAVGGGGAGLQALISWNEIL